MNPRLRRLQADYQQVREVYSGHPNVRVEPVGTRLPPETYRITLDLRGLELIDGKPEFREQHEVELMLPRRYPAEKPYAVPKTPIFHPNIREYYCLVDEENWTAGTKLVDLISKIGDMIQFRVYNLASPLDPDAARWTRDREPSGIFPIGDVDLGVAEVDLSLNSPRPAPAHHGVVMESSDKPVMNTGDFVVELRDD